MSQNKLSNVYNLQWELSNPQYYPDDSAPPVPNMAISSVEQSSLTFNNTSDYESLSDLNRLPTGLSDLQNFAGVPNDLGFDYRTGATERTADHIFYSYLNVDARIPPFHLSGKDEHLLTYYRDFVPAACGLYNVEVPEGGNHLGYMCIPDGREEASFAYSEKDELMQGLYPTLGSMTFRNRSLTQPRRFDVIDFAIHIIEYDHTSTRSYVVRGPDFDITYRLHARGSSLTISIDLVDSSRTTTILESTTISNNTRNENLYMFFRVDFTNGIVELLSETGENEGSFYTSSSFAPYSTTPLFNVREFHVPNPFGVLRNHSIQLIGYTRDNVAPFQEQYTNAVPFKKYFYRLAYNFDYWSGGDQEDIDEEILNFTIPAHNGNAWAYLNQLSTMFPFVRLV